MTKKPNTSIDHKLLDQLRKSEQNAKQTLFITGNRKQVEDTVDELAKNKELKTAMLKLADA